MRETRLQLLIGTNGTGKSTLARKLIDAKLQSNHAKVLVITPHDTEWLDVPVLDLHTVTKKAFEQMHSFTGIRKHTAYDETFLKIIAHPQLYYRNGLIVFDDCRAYLESAIEKETRAMFISRRQRKIDMIAVAHGFTDIPPKFFTFATDLYLFRTLDGLRSRKGVFFNMDTLEKYREAVNQRAQIDSHFYKHIDLKKL